MTDNNRFAELIECFITNKIVRNQQEFVEKIGSDKATVSQIKNGKLPITNSILDKIKNAFPNVSVDWLLTGEGEMLKSDNSVKIFVPEDLPKQVGRLYRAPIYESYPVSAGLHGLAAIRDDKPDGYAYTTMPGVTFFPVIGCSFEPIIYAGEYIGVVKLNSWDRVDTEKIYFIITKEERMLKRLRVDKDREDILWCVSPNFSEFSILKSDIVEINHVFFYGKMI
jgi:transcriptional regulator with XRE-family HTH domain